MPIVALLIAFALPGSWPEEYSRGLGILAGFWYAVPRYSAPATWTARLGVALLGLVIVIGVYLGLGVAAGLLPAALDGPLRAVRYFVLAVVAVQGVPALLAGLDAARRAAAVMRRPTAQRRLVRL